MVKNMIETGELYFQARCFDVKDLLEGTPNPEIEE